jgi:hypothetical protein
MPGKTYYYAEITNTNPGATGRKVSTAVSDAAVVVVGNPRTNAKPPEITGQPAGKTYTQDATSTPLSVTATSPDGGTLTYQWFTNTTNDSQGGSPIIGATGETYIPPTDATGALYYYAVVTNTNPAATGNQTSVRVTDPALITVNPKKDAETPKITTQPQGGTYPYGDTPTLSVTVATPTDGGTTSCQWYKNTVNSNQGGTPISGETPCDESFTPPNDPGKAYYYVVVTNTNGSASGSPTASIASDPALVTVNAQTFTVRFFDETGERTDLSASYPSQNITLISLSPPTGFTFAGWSVNNTETPRTGTYYVSSNVDFYAKWTTTDASKPKVKAAFYDDGVQITVIEEYPENYITLPARTRKDYTFEGWKKGVSGTPPYLNGPYRIAADTDFYAEWTLSLTCIPVGTETGLIDIKDGLSGCYKLTTDITLTAPWVPVGDSKTNPFTGTLDGQEHTISGLNVSNKDYAGLFGYIDSGARVDNLTLVIDPKGISGTSYAGGVAGFAGAGKIVDVHVTTGTGVNTGAITSSGAHAGGIAGNMAGAMSGISCNPDRYAIIYKSENTVNVQSAQFSGGISGETNRCSQIILSVNKGSVSAVNTAANGSVSSGGVQGSGTGTVLNSANSGAVSGSGSAHAYVGGITGGNNGAKLYRSFNSGTVSAVSSAGEALAGGTASYLRAGDYLNDIYNTADIAATGITSAYAGGIAGSEFGGSVSRTYNRGNVTASVSSASGESRAGGIIGFVSGGSIENSFAANTALSSKNTKGGTATANRIMTHMNPADIISSVNNNFALSVPPMTITGTQSTLSSFTGMTKALSWFVTNNTNYVSAVSGNGNGGLGWLFDGDNDTAPWKWGPDTGHTWSSTYTYPTLYWQTDDTPPMP